MKYSLARKVFPINALPAYQFANAGIDRISCGADIKFEAVKRYYQEVDADVLFFFSDIAIQAEAMGAETRLAPDAMPSVKPKPISMQSVSPANAPRMKVNADVLKKMSTAFPEKLLSTMVYGPFTVAGQLAGEREIMRGIVETPGEASDLVEKALVCAKAYAQYLLDAGADILWVSDPLAALLPPKEFQRFAGDFLARLFDIYPDGPSILHICGDISLHLNDMLETGVKGVSFDQCMDIIACEDAVPDHIGLIGNIDPVEVIETGGLEDVDAAVKDLAALMGVKSNFVLSTGCALPPMTPISNAVRFIETGRSCLEKLEPYASELESLGNDVYQGELANANSKVSRILEADAEPITVMNSGLMRAVRKGSALYERKNCFLPEILLMVDAFYQGFRILEPRMGIEKKQSPQIILGTVKGDCHEIGKDLLRIILEAHNVKTLDLGVDVSAERFLEAARSYGVSLIGLSVFIASARKEIAKTMEAFKTAGISDAFFIVGGAAVNHQIAASLGADGYARDAIEAIKVVKKFLKRS